MLCGCCLQKFICFGEKPFSRKIIGTFKSIFTLLELCVVDVNVIIGVFSSIIVEVLTLQKVLSTQLTHCLSLNR